MAYDKVTKIDSIAKRKAWSKVNQGVLTEHANAFHRADTNLNVRLVDTFAQRTLQVAKSGKMFRRSAVVGAGVSTSWPTNPGLRKARKA